MSCARARPQRARGEGGEAPQPREGLPQVLSWVLAAGDRGWGAWGWEGVWLWSALPSAVPAVLCSITLPGALSCEWVQVVSSDRWHGPPLAQPVPGGNGPSARTETKSVASSVSCVSPPGKSVGNTCPVDLLQSTQVDMRDIERDVEALRKLKTMVVKYL